MSESAKPQSDTALNGGALNDGALKPERMIRGREIQPARWAVRLDGSAPKGADEAVTLSAWLSLDDADRRKTGVVLEGDDDLAGLSDDITVAPVVALHFPKFTDGRCYSHAYRLRRMLGFTGPILAVGDVLRDQMPYMDRCGIRDFYPRADQNLEGCLAQLGHFTRHYQYQTAIPGNA